MKIKAWKGGRSERIYARITKEAKAKLLARVKHEGYKSLADWLEVQAVAQPTKRALDAANAPANFPTLDRALRSGWVALATTPRK